MCLFIRARLQRTGPRRLKMLNWQRTWRTGSITRWYRERTRKRPCDAIETLSDFRLTSDWTHTQPVPVYIPLKAVCQISRIYQWGLTDEAFLFFLNSSMIFWSCSISVNPRYYSPSTTPQHQNLPAGFKCMLIKLLPKLCKLLHPERIIDFPTVLECFKDNSTKSNLILHV